jgi:hypothetical protein
MRIYLLLWGYVFHFLHFREQSLVALAHRRELLDDPGNSVENEWFHLFDRGSIQFRSDWRLEKRIAQTRVPM